ncbi:ATPase [Fictibacillus sp. 5RED26]|uniref:VirB4 family type IV secretion system protein n=1 Tax=Fictibacillus sp. 5RED26 TaxID=2745876 RepID=UPI0018CF5242|nr:ATPase [Fictibacillus sp. 5RED26]MBH0158708.1 ATPase [Fictibacillus sp. 5RED26]
MSVEKDIALIYETQPMGGISFKEEYYNRKGDGYEACLHVYRFPNVFTEFWLNEITSLENTIVTVDTFTTQDVNYVEKVTHSTEELRSRRDNAKNQSQYDVANEEFETLRELGLALHKEGEVIKRIHVRIYINAPTQIQLEERINKICKSLDSDGYKSIVFLDEQKEEWQAKFLDYESQQKLVNKRPGIEIPAEALGLGFAHDQTSLKDPTGAYYGYTRTRGTVYWDMFHQTMKRLYYNLFVSGDMGSGKSTLLKKILRDNALKGNFIRGFDKSGEFLAVTEDFGGKTINLDGSGGRVNLFQVFPTVSTEGENELKVDEAASFRQHVSKLNMCYLMLNPKSTDAEQQQFDELVYDFYVFKNLWDYSGDVRITNLPAEDYPILSEFHAYCLERYQLEEDERFKGRIGDISKSIGNLVRQYGELFDGCTTIPDMTHEQIVFYDIGNLSQLKKEIFDIQVFNALTQIWANMMHSGRREKDAYDTQTKHWWDIKRFLIIVDECHNVLNMEKSFTADFFVTLMSEARKFFGGVVLATQRMERMFPKADNVANEKMALASNKLSEIFGLTQYKAIFRQDATSMKLIKNLFGDQMTDMEYGMMPTFDKGNCVLSIAGDQNLVMTVEVTPEELALFKGGA